MTNFTDLLDVYLMRRKAYYEAMKDVDDHSRFEQSPACQRYIEARDLLNDYARSLVRHELPTPFA